MYKSKQINQKWWKKLRLLWNVYFDYSPINCCHVNVWHIQVVYQFKFFFSNDIAPSNFFQVYWFLICLFEKRKIVSTRDERFSCSNFIWCVLCLFVSIFIEALQLQWNCMCIWCQYDESSIDFYEFDPFQHFPLSEML